MAPRDPLARARRLPAPSDWADDDAMTLAEAVAVFWPHGPLTIASLRTEIRKGRLTRAQVAGKDFVTPRALRALFEPATCPAAPKAPASTSVAASSTKAAASPTSGSSGTERLRSAQAAALIACEALTGRKSSSPATSPRRGPRPRLATPPTPAAQVVRLRS